MGYTLFALDIDGYTVMWSLCLLQGNIYGELCWKSRCFIAVVTFSNSCADWSATVITLKDLRRIPAPSYAFNRSLRYNCLCQAKRFQLLLYGGTALCASSLNFRSLLLRRYHTLSSASHYTLTLTTNFPQYFDIHPFRSLPGANSLSFIPSPSLPLLRYSAA
jgi:hypothetical protein